MQGGGILLRETTGNREDNMRSKAAIARAARKRADRAQQKAVYLRGSWDSTEKAADVVKKRAGKAYRAWNMAAGKATELTAIANAAPKDAEAEGK